jgi:hypothetical protein
MAAKALNRMRIVGLSLPLRPAGPAIGFFLGENEQYHKEYVKTKTRPPAFDHRKKRQ